MRKMADLITDCLSQELTEYHIQLATFNQTRRLWAELYLEIARPPEQIELDLMREVLKMNLVSHLKRTEIKGQELFRAALLEVMFRTQPDLEKVVDGVPWRVIVSGKIDAALAAVEECKTCTRGLALNPLSGKEAAHLERTGSLLGRKNVVPSRS